MKKQLFTIAALVMAATATAQVVNIPDSNFKSYLVGEASINTNSDGEIQVSEATAFSGQIILDNLNIADVTGLEAFVNITTLSANGNQITSLDVSQNTAITYISAGNNPYTDVNIANGNNTNMTVLYFGLVPTLTCVQVDDPAYSLANWTGGALYFDPQVSFSLNCEPIVNIPDANFKAYCVGTASINTNGDSEIQVSEAEATTPGIFVDNMNIADLTGIEAFTNITQLSANGNQLTTLDVSQNTAITYISAGNNPYTEVNIANGNNTNMTVLYFGLVPTLTCVEVDDPAYSVANWTGGALFFDAQISFSLDCGATVLNEECGTAADINSLFGGAVNTPMVSTLYDNTGYTSVGDPATGWECFGDDPTPALDYTMWFAFTGDGDTYQIRTVECNSTNYIDLGETQAAIYSGSDCSNLSPVACNDDEDANNGLFNFQINLQTILGTEYYMFVDGWTGFTGEFCLEVTRETANGIGDADYQAVELYPNPTEGIISWNGINAQTAEIMDNIGRVVMNVAQPNGTVDISELTEGIYILKLFTEEGAFTSRVVKQ